MEAKRVIIGRELARKLRGQFYKEATVFNPFLDEDMNICISEQEIEQITNKDFEFLKSMLPKDKSELLKNFTTEKQWIEFYKQEADKESARLDAELKKIPKDPKI